MDGAGKTSSDFGDMGGAQATELWDHIRKLQAEVEQRDNEIQILISHLEKKRGGVAVTSSDQVSTAIEEEKESSVGNTLY